MKDLKIDETEITWKTVKHKYGCEYTYENTILNHGDHISVIKFMYVNGEFKHSDLAHIPIQLIDKIKDLKQGD